MNAPAASGSQRELWRLLGVGAAMVFALCFGAGAAAPKTGKGGKSNAIGGQFSAAFEGFNDSGQPRVRLRLNLSCSLQCPPSAPKLTYGVMGGAEARFVSAPNETAGVISAGFVAGVRERGSSDIVSTSFSAGTHFTARARSVTCQCGNRTGEGGYIELTTQPVAIPPWPAIAVPPKVNTVSVLTVLGKPRGPETIELRVSGAGLEATKTFSAEEFMGRSSLAWTITPTRAGTLTVTATLQPSRASHSRTFTVGAQ